MVPEIGKKYGPYEILGHLGGGGMGFVYRAWDARLHREVAIKLLHSEYTMPGMRERFLREARAASALNHPNICTIFDIGEQNGEPYLVMELLQGETLKDRIDYRAVHVDELLLVGREVAEALGAAHAKGVIHRDIKPANIFLVDKPNGTIQAKVLDFGLAKFQGGVLGARTNRSLELTAAGATVGTLAYMSPEQARGEVLDSRSDLFSLGVVLYEMATRHIPFPGATSALVFVQLLNHQPESVRNWNESIPKELDKIIFKLMSKERTQRFQTAQELEQALAKIGEKSSGGGWLRKAKHDSPPPVRGADPVAREKRIGRKSSDSNVDAARPASPNPSEHAPKRTSGGEQKFLRPVARVPRPDSPEPEHHADESYRPTPARYNSIAVDSGGGVPAARHDDEIDTAAFRAISEEPYTRPDREASRIKRSRFGPLQIGIAVAVALAILAVVAFFLFRDRFRSALLSDQDTVVLSQIDNRTGDKMLDGVVAAGLQLALAQSPYLRLDTVAAYRAALHLAAPEAGDEPSQIMARNAAQKLGAKAFIYGTIAGATPPYLIHLDVFGTASNDTLTSVEDHVPSLQEVPASIDRLADGLRSSLGEKSDSITKTHIPLSREATSNLEALHALSQGDLAHSDGKTLEAVRFYQQAIALEPKFVQAHLRLTELYRKQRAEVAAAESAKLALAAADNASERTRAIAQYQYEMNASGDYVRAASIIRQLVSTNPHDSEALAELARALRLQGRGTEALQTAQQAYAEDAFNVDGYTQAELSLISLDRYEAAVQVDAQVQKLGFDHPGSALAAAYLGGRDDLLASAVAALDGRRAGYSPDWNYGIYLDNVGRLAAGAALWRARASAALEIRGFESAAGLLLSQGAIDRALLGDCPNGLAMAREADAHPEGMTALFNSGMTTALCGDSARARQIAARLQQDYPQSFEVKGFYLVDIKAAVALHDQDPTTALELLKSARQYDLISLTPLLRGRAHVALRQVQIGIVDFQTVLSHRGVPFTVGSMDYPVAEIGVARAFADTGDQGNSAEAYRRFVDLWKTADPNQPLLAEARAHSH